MSEKMRNPFAGKRIEELGTSASAVYAAHQRKVLKGEFEFDLSGANIPQILAKAEDDGGGATVHRPLGEDPKRVWIQVRANTQRPGGPFGWHYDVFAVARGPVEGTVYATKVAELDADGLVQFEKE